MMKTVLFTLDDYHTGGVLTLAIQYTSVLVDSGYRVIVLGRQSNEKNLKLFFPGCIIVEIPSYLRKNGLVGRVLDFFEYFKYLDSIYLRYKVNVVHFSLVWSTLYSLAHHKTWKKKKVITFHGAYDLEKNSTSFKKNLFHGARSFFRKKLQLFVLKLMDKVVVLSSYSKDLIEKHFSKKLIKSVRVVEGFVNDDETLLLKKKKKNQIVLVNFGRAEPNKGLDILLKAARILLDKGHEVKIIIGSPVYYFKLYKLLDLYEELDLFDAVQFIHCVSSKRKLEILSMADLFIIPSKNLETFGMTIIESLSKGVPVIGSNVGAIPEILSKISKDLIFNPNENDLVKKIEKYIDLSSAEKNILRHKSIDVVRSFYTKSIVQNKIINLY